MSNQTMVQASQSSNPQQSKKKRKKKKESEGMFTEFKDGSEETGRPWHEIVDPSGWRREP